MDNARAGLRSSQTVGDLVEAVAGLLGDARDARELVAAFFDEPKHWPLVKDNKWVESAEWQAAMAAAAKRARGAPLAYAVGRANFRSLTLAVDERVLIPRPETELLVDLVLQRARTGAALDVGTGSGAIAIALATEGSFERVTATDISLDALEVARGNAATCGASVDFEVGTFPSTGTFTTIVSNPPYIALGEAASLPASVRDWEPALALFSGQDGMGTTAQLVRLAPHRLEPGGLLALEVDARRASLVAELLASDGRYDNITVELDLTGRERFVLATREE